MSSSIFSVTGGLPHLFETCMLLVGIRTNSRKKCVQTAKNQFFLVSVSRLTLYQGRHLQIRQDPHQNGSRGENSRPGGGRPPNRDPTRSPRGRSLQCNQDWQLPILDSLRASHGPEGRRDQHLRHDQSVATGRLSSTTDWENDAESKRKTPYFNFNEGRHQLTASQPSNYFADIEQAAFAPSNMFPGIAPGADPSKQATLPTSAETLPRYSKIPTLTLPSVLQARMFAYPDAARYGLGTNYQFLPTNAAKSPVYCPCQRDGSMNFTSNYGSDPNYVRSSIFPIKFLDDDNNNSSSDQTSGVVKSKRVLTTISEHEKWVSQVCSFTSAITDEGFVQGGWAVGSHRTGEGASGEIRAECGWTCQWCDLRGTQGGSVWQDFPFIRPSLLLRALLCSSCLTGANIALFRNSALLPRQPFPGLSNCSSHHETPAKVPMSRLF